MNKMKVSTIEISRFGRRLGTRLEGEAARRVLAAALDELPPGGQLALDLRGVDVLSGSFADEAIGRLSGLVASGAYGDRTLVVRSPTLDLVEDLADKLAQRKLALFCRVDDRWVVLGRLARPLRETLDLINERRRTTTKELADALAVPANVCHNRVRRLVTLGLVREERIDAAAPQTQYRFHAVVE
ncbi:MAG: winged helix-turn-helix transcriptional regulator [Candidatus Bipolaricaulota bacterium]